MHQNKGSNGDMNKLSTTLKPPPVSFWPGFGQYQARGDCAGFAALPPAMRRRSELVSNDASMWKLVIVDSQNLVRPLHLGGDS